LTTGPDSNRVKSESCDQGSALLAAVRRVLHGLSGLEDMKHRVIFSLALILFVMFGHVPLLAPHPHVFIYNSIKVVFDEKGLAGFEMKWVFDEMFSNMIIHDFDKNRNGHLESSDIKDIKNGAFSNLKKFNYFTHIKINNGVFKVNSVKDFSAEIKENTLIYRFFVPCHVRAGSSFKEVRISIYDVSFYCSVFLAKNPVGFENTSSYELHHQIGKNKKEAYYYGQVCPDEIIVRFRRKTG